MKTFLVPPLGLLFLACNNASDTKEQSIIPKVDTPAQVEEVAGKTEVTHSIPTNIQVDSVIYLAFAPDSISATVKGHLDKKGNPVICYLPITKGTRLAASVNAENPKATIRFSHIYQPDGKSDGPFGNNMKYALKQKGTYKLYIGPNKMAGDPGSTDFVLKVRVDN